MVVSKNRGGPPKWMVKIMENLIKMEDLGGTPYFWKHPYMRTKMFYTWHTALQCFYKSNTKLRQDVLLKNTYPDAGA